MTHADTNQRIRDCAPSQAPRPESPSVSAAEAHRQLCNATEALLIDVRTLEETQQEGAPAGGTLAAQSHLISWRVAPDFAANPHFAAQMTQLLAQHPQSEAPLYFLCKAGIRSQEAANHTQTLTNRPCYNIAGGSHGQQGWHQHNLPWGGAAA